MLQRFVDGDGMLYDLEFLEGKRRLWPHKSRTSFIAVADLATLDQNRRRVAAFGESAGYCGAGTCSAHKFQLHLRTGRDWLLRAFLDNDTADWEGVTLSHRNHGLGMAA